MLKVIQDKLLVQTIFPELDAEGKIILELQVFMETRNQHGRMRTLYKSIQNYSSIEENTFLKERGMLGPYNTSVSHYLYC